VDNVELMLEHRGFGRTGHDSSRVIFGAAALSRITQDKADALLPVLEEFGVNHLDVAASYGDAELRLAPWLDTRRADFFVATKTGDRDGDGARASLERSLTRLGVDSVDLIQLHNLVEPDEWEVAHARGGAVEGLARAREEGLVRFIGVTGHGTRIASMHLRSLERFDFDSVLLPYNFALLEDRDYRADVDALLRVCAERTVAVQAIKAVARRRWRDDDGPRFSWYEPLRDERAIANSVSYVLAHDQLFLNSSSDATLLRPILEAASRAAERPAADVMSRDVAAHGIEPLFDGAALDRI
jgi:aryl-alcohol dehydrogenase-like predicted oxidoreductase